ncbi:hypothetical protein RhiTH_009361 [Rhizoctonia solani]
MATCSQPPSRACSPLNQGELGPYLPTTTPIKLGEVSLKQITCLLFGLLGQVENLEQKVEEVQEAGVKACTNLENVSQAVDGIKDGLRSLQGPYTLEGAKPKVVDKTPCPIPKAKPIGSATPPQVPSPPPSLCLQSPIGAPAPPLPAPVAAYPAPIKVNHPDAYTGKIGSKAKQWLTRMLAWTHLNLWMFPTNQEVLSFLLMNMKDATGAWAHLHLDQLGSHWAIIQMVEGFKLEFLAAFGNPDATRAAKQKITSLTQSGTCQWNCTGMTWLSEANLPMASTGRSAAKLQPMSTALVS